MSFFSNTYLEAKQRFLTEAERAGARLERLKIEPLGPNGEELTIDIAILGDLNAPKIFLHTSGIHGVEGFAGSAVQLAALSHKIRGDHNVALVFVHILNPFGMAWLRRVNECNVDLNRNFLPPGEPYKSADQTYGALDKVLNSPATQAWFWLQLLNQLIRLGFDPLKKAIVQGQYDFPNGLFFGGDRLQQSCELYKLWLIKNIKSAKTVVALDVHTGLGGFAEEVLFCHAPGAAPDIGRKITALSATAGYKVRGGLESLTQQVFPNAQWVHFTQEFGTYSMAKVLRALHAENLQRKPSPRFKQIMYPEDANWRHKALEHGLETFNRALNWLATQ